MLSLDHNQRQSQPRGTVLILCIALLVILGMLASGFVILTLYQRSGSRSLSRAENAEQVRQMSLTYVRGLLLDDIVTSGGQFLGNDYDAPGTDPWLSAHGSTGGAVDTDHDGTNDTDWIISPGETAFPGFLNLANGADSDGNAVIISPDGTSYRVAIRIVDTNGLANINVGLDRYIDDTVDPSRKSWKGEFPAYLCLNLDSFFPTVAVPATDHVLDNGDGASVLGRYNDAAIEPPLMTHAEVAEELHDNLYRYLAHPNPPTATVRPFDIAEEINLRTIPALNAGLHGRLTHFWPEVRDELLADNPCFFTAYSWTMQIRPLSPPFMPIEAELTALGFPAPCMISLNGLVNPDNTINEEACRAVYLGLLASGIDTNTAIQLLVNLVDYIDNDDAIRVVNTDSAPTDSIINFGEWITSAPTPTAGTVYYGTDSQPIISEVYSYRFYDGTPLGTVPTETYNYTLNTTLSRYAVELFNPSSDDIDLSGWTLNVGATTYNLSGTIAAGDFWTISSHSNDHLANTIPDPKQVIGPPGPPTPFAIGTDTQTIELVRQGPAGVADPVVVDACEQDFGAVPPNGGTDPNPVVARDFQRPGNNVGATLIPVIDQFESEPLASVGLGDYAVTDNGGQGGQLVLNNTGELHSVGELFNVPKIANAGTGADLIEMIEAHPDDDSYYRLPPDGRKILQYLTLRTGIKDFDFSVAPPDPIDNDGDGYANVEYDDLDNDAGTPDELVPWSLLEARVPGLINVNTAPEEVLQALHYYYQSGTDDIADFIFQSRQPAPTGSGPFKSLHDLADRMLKGTPATDSKDEDPGSEGVGSPDGITGINADNEEKLFHFKNVANLISVRSDVFVVYITVQARRDGADVGQPLRTMAIVDRSLCLRPNGTSLADIPLPRILAQTTLP